MKDFIAFLLFFIVLNLHSQQWKQNFKIVEPMRVRDNGFGICVATNNGYAAYSSNLADVGGIINAGKVYIAKQDCDGWTIYQELSLPDGINYCDFGSKLLMEGKTLVIRACDPLNSNRGNAVYIYERNSNDLYVFTQKITKSENAQADNFSSNIAISENFMVIGASHNSTDASLGNYLENAGAAYVYRKGPNGVWTQVQKIVASDRERRDTFGNSVGIFKNTIVVGAAEEGVNWAGAAYVFEKSNTSDTWREVKKLTAYDFRGLQDNFGEVVRINENGIVISAPKDDDYDSDLSGDGGGVLTELGSVYIFKKNSNNEWAGYQKIRASDGSASIFGFGGDMEIYEDKIAIRGTEYEYNNGILSKVFGRVYMFQKGDNDRWTESQIVQSNVKRNSDWFGGSISLHKNDLFISAYWDALDANGQNYIGYAGTVYIFNTYNYVNMQKPILNSIPILESCADLGDGFSSGFDMSSVERDLVTDPDKFVFSYSDELGNKLPSPLPINYPNANPYSEVINVRVGNKNNPNCYEDTTIELKTVSHFSLNKVPDFQECDSKGTGFAVFDLSKINSTLVDNPSLFMFSYFDKNKNDISSLINEYYVNSSKNFEEIIVNVTEISTSCTAKTKINLSVSNVGLDCKQEIEGYNIPKFFTPNADGVNDIWEITGINNQNYNIYIYDRYGKLLKTLGQNSGWDGNYNGAPLQSSDYWYQIVFENGLDKKGHFSLKR
jgi:gliding motility-associated-like protein